MSKKIVAYECWSNERHIQITADGNDAGIIQPALFRTLEAARKYYDHKLQRCSLDDPIVKVTVEIVAPPQAKEMKNGNQD